MGLLAHNLVRHSLLQAGSPRRMLATPTQLLCNAAILSNHLVAHGSQLPQSAFVDRTPTNPLASHHVGNRPNRIEPRTIKRRAIAYDWLTKPRKIARAQLLMGSST